LLGFGSWIRGGGAPELVEGSGETEAGRRAMICHDHRDRARGLAGSRRSAGCRVSAGIFWIENWID
jgi:hypothetical protein